VIFRVCLDVYGSHPAAAASTRSATKFEKFCVRCRNFGLAT
jgi:hypothetical protein